MADVFCSTDVPDYVQTDCGIERAGIVAMVLIDTDVGTPSDANLTTASYWTSLTGQSPPLAYIIKKTRGEYPGGTPTEEEGFGREATRVTGADHESPIEVEGLLDNRDFWEGVNRRNWKLGIVTNGDLLLYVDNPVTVYAKMNVPRDIKTGTFWMINIKWQEFSNPRVVDVSGITTFDEE